MRRSRLWSPTSTRAGCSTRPWSSGWANSDAPPGSPATRGPPGEITIPRPGAASCSGRHQGRPGGRQNRQGRGRGDRKTDLRGRLPGHGLLAPRDRLHQGKRHPHRSTDSDRGQGGEADHRGHRLIDSRLLPPWFHSAVARILDQPRPRNRWLNATASTTTVPSTNPSIWDGSTPLTTIAVPLITI